MKQNFNKFIFEKVILKTTKILLPINQIDFQSGVIFGRENTLPDLKSEQTPVTTLDVKIQIENSSGSKNITMKKHTH